MSEGNKSGAVLFDLLNSKNYEELSVEEKELVDKEVAKEQYLSMRLMIVQRLKHSNLSEPPVAIRQELLKKFKEKKLRGSNVNLQYVKDLLVFPVPAYKSAIAASFLMVAIWFLVGNKEGGKELEYITKIDTVYVPLATLHDTISDQFVADIVKEKIKPGREEGVILKNKNNIEKIIKTDQPSPTTHMVGSMETVQVTEFNYQLIGGSSLKDDSIISNYIVQIH